jgi:hypothetical protein
VMVMTRSQLAANWLPTGAASALTTAMTGMGHVGNDS